MRKKRFSSGIALLALSASGCGVTAAVPDGDIVVPAEPTSIDFVDPTTVVGLSTRTLTEGDSTNDRYAHITYPEVDEAPALNRTLRERVREQLRVFRERTKTRAPRLRPELNVTWRLAAASPEAVAVRLRTGEKLTAGWGYSTRTYWFDPHEGKAVRSSGLLAGKDAMRRLGVLVKRRLLQERGSQIEADGIIADGDRFDSMAFNRDGDLVVEFDDCQVGPCRLGRVAAAVPADDVAPLLSDLGTRAQEGVRTAARKAAELMNGDRNGPPPTDDPANNTEAVRNLAVTTDCAETKCVALTFEDGPGPNTGALLDKLQEGKARATFFPLGTNTAANPDLVLRMSAEGHLVGNHGWTHRNLSDLPTSKIADSLRQAGNTISAATGRTPTLVRPPYGAVGPKLRAVAADQGVSLVTWDVDAHDHKGGKSADIADRAVRAAHPGAIILMHDIHRETVDAVPDILERLRGKGYSFVTVPELYGSAGMQAGRMYRSGSEQPRT
ncbi:polysaccharide deacetylase family protein [Nonomuraea diastatica]|uniref:Polysaccharide deacetylase family protein n=1 Tax=Nonomuraea diastatica TaxID=1848329 RepID=A0A4R4WZU3_9ACTN|nr:polysaccharide deacetylase family protein [Nonomuraea diastatica]TDD23361.1 polysaccharide deacetylase family protein [Nonomuraea diastatica]